MAGEENNEQVRIVTLEPVRVASVHGFGKEPEHLAWSKLEEWAGPKGYIDDLEHHRIFGFNNPNPSAGSPNYGYEFWMEVSRDEPSGGGARIEEFAGGDYAVSRVEVVGDAYEVIPNGWQRLHRWCEEQGLRFGHHQWLEQHLSAPGGDEGLTLDLYMPIMR
jgi:DNA gyrase inhibitor GyrI